ncbi:MAG: hypothetical protein HYV04_16125 [Deltaproteobacteria bacterium]|nr:hypothetical protein [Deltaproteobacteria bacterium]
MESGTKYEFRREEDWNLLVLPGQWGEGLRKELLGQLESHAPDHHPQTARFDYPAGENGATFYLKIYHSVRFFGSVKDLFRDSKAFRALKQGTVLSGLGFHVPLAVAAGEQRRYRSLKRAFLLTLSVKARPLPLFLRESFSPPLEKSALKQKREYIAKLAQEVRHLHELGFVHGDLVPSNILIRPEAGGATFFFVDNDRTRRYPCWLPLLLWRRNLVQLNRFRLAGISLQDRLRFLNSYLSPDHGREKRRRLIQRLERKTRERLEERDPRAARVSFRKLMRWSKPSS